MVNIRHGRGGSAKVAAVLVAVVVVAGGGALAWYFLDQPVGEKKDAARGSDKNRAVVDSHATNAKSTRKPRPRVITNSIEMELALIPAGKFRMGSPDTEKDRAGDEGPVHEVEITKPFYLGVREVTQEQFARVMGRNTSLFSFERGNQARLEGVTHTKNFPVDSVTWNEAVEFCEKLSELIGERNAGRVYRLPTEAEWEYACRAGTSTAFSCGDSLGAKQANFNDEQPAGGTPAAANQQRTRKVGSYPANDFGLSDMHGNVWEWCADYYGPYAAGAAKDPTGPEQGESRVLRGGSWIHPANLCRSARRLPAVPALQEWYIGFRVAVTK